MSRGLLLLFAAKVIVTSGRVYSVGDRLWTCWQQVVLVLLFGKDLMLALGDSSEWLSSQRSSEQVGNSLLGSIIDALWDGSAVIGLSAELGGNQEICRPYKKARHHPVSQHLQRGEGASERCAEVGWWGKKLASLRTRAPAFKNCKSAFTSKFERKYSLNDQVCGQKI